MTSYEVNPIGRISNKEDGSLIELNPEFIPALKALDGFSHINVLWWFSDFDTKEARAILETCLLYTSPICFPSLFLF